MPLHRFTFALVVVLLLAGCASPAPRAIPPPAMNLAAQDSVVEVTLHTVVVRGRAGTWIKDPHWDEYVLTLANRSPVPVTVESIVLDDILDQRQVGSDDPKKLFQNTRKNWKAYRQGKVPVFKQKFEPTALEIVAGGVLVAAELAYAWPVTLALLPGALIAGSHQKAKVNAEFSQRRLVLPLTLAPDSSTKGSIFFPMTAAPRRLVIRTQTGSQPLELVMTLEPLSQLHLVSPAGSVASSSLPVSATQ